ncbi:Predicted acyltransferase [Mariniphaga anaerophila]|uniref:Predicted acyltransferase n=1 Tax=Mariniphaga anaerophila TaxID=1484053 RepID=A0A1M5DYW9_9BACT|nr:heparan-alpha-glucosaminide N-acetyltransferase domain-containing protein [Mariniphaga anaerophila]SHF72074.1 Predicted acyltransferase [Mariniphaga anaerophila]
MAETKRLISLDAFRGFTIAAMIMVNNPGSWSHVYKPLLHVEWNGLTPTDLIFPFFIFIVGVSITLAYTKRLQAGVPKVPMYKKIVFRSLKIFVVGVLLWLFPKFDFESIRYAGVLQRIAVVFLFSALLFLNSKWKTQAIVAAVLVVGYWLAMVLIPTPGYGEAMLEPGANLAAWIDTKLLPGYMWQKTWDPEGLFSTLPAIATAISGMLAGHLILSKIPQERKVIYMFSFGFFAFVIGYWWDFIFPINKNIWTSSFVMVTSGLAAMVLAISLFFVDVMGRTRFTKPGIIFGSNAIAVYVLSDVWRLFFYQLKIAGNSLNVHFLDMFESAGWSLKFGSLLFALLFICFNFIPAWILYKKKIFIKL